jgi:meso-butanediol dehydrogenase / (S,S)-butanediol dehydrogenase / diacetyl reductase
MSARALVTGGASGIGRAIVDRFGRDGARLVVLDRDPEAPARLAEAPGVARVVVGDVSDPDDVARAFDAVDQVLGGLDLAVNNAGISLRHRFLDIALADWRRVLDVNLTGTFLVAQQAARRMLAGGGGTLLNVASVNGLAGFPLYADYNASKAGVIELSRTLALELAPTVRVLAICPGYVLTPMQEAEYTPEMLAACAEKVPAGRLARPDEIAGLCAFLASREAAFMTGSPVVIDGGEISGGLASR